MSNDASIYDNLPMTHRMALMLLQRAGQPNPSWGGALGNALAAGVGGYFEGQEERQAIKGKADVNAAFSQPGPSPAPPPPPPPPAPPMASSPGGPVITPEAMLAHGALPPDPQFSGRFSADQFAPAPPNSALAAALVNRGNAGEPVPPPDVNTAAKGDSLPAPAPFAARFPTDQPPSNPALAAGLAARVAPPFNQTFSDAAQAPPGGLRPRDLAASREPATFGGPLPFAGPDQPDAPPEALARALVTQGGSGLNLSPAANSMSPADRDKVIRTVIGEADGEPPEGKQAVANVILNRAQLSGQSPGNIVTAPNQFEPWNTAGGRARMNRPTPDSPSYQAAAQAVDAALGGDITNGATHFYSPGVQSALGRQPPSWAGGQPGQRIGSQQFYSLPFGGQPAQALAFNGTPQQQPQPPAPKSIFDAQLYAPSNMQQQAPAPVQGPVQPQAAPAQQPQGQIGGYTPQVLETLRGYAADSSNPVRAGEAQKYLDHYNSLVATPHQQFQTIKTPTGDVPVFIDTNKGTMTKAELPGGATLASLTGDPNVAGPEYLQTMPDPGRRKMVEAIGTGQMAYPSARMNPQANSIIGEVRQAFPNSTAEDYPNRLKADNAFTVGKEGQALKSTRQAIGHSLELATMQDKLEKYFSDRGIGQFPNSIYGFIQNNTDPEFKQLWSAYNNLAQKVGVETEKSALGGKPPAGDAKSVVASLDMLNGPSAARGALQGNAQFLAENSNALHEQYNTRTPNLPPRAPPDFLNEREQYGIRSLRETGRFDPSQAPPVPVNTPDEAYRYPSGTRIVMPNGQIGVVPQFKPGGR